MDFVKIIKIPSETGAGTRGASKGIAALEEAAAEAGSDFFTRHASDTVPHKYDLIDETYPTARRIKSVAQVLEKSTTVISDALRVGYHLLILSGDHSIAAASIAGIKSAYRSKRIGVVWIDAHADIHTPHTTPSGNMHGMPLSMALATNNKAYRDNFPSEEVSRQWERLKNLGIPGPKLNTKDIVYIGLRDMEREEAGYIRDHHIRVIGMAEVSRHTPEEVAEMALDHLWQSDMLYISFDVDSLDPEAAPGTGTKSPGGLSFDQAHRILKTLAAHERTVCLEVTELNPDLDVDKKTVRAVFNIINDILP